MPALVSSLIPTAMALREARVVDRDRVPVQVWEVLSTLSDPRQRQGRRHPFATVLVVAVAGVLAGAMGCPMISGHEFWVFQAASWGLLWRSRISCGVLYPNPE